MSWLKYFRKDCQIFGSQKHLVFHLLPASRVDKNLSALFNADVSRCIPALLQHKAFMQTVIPTSYAITDCNIYRGSYMGAHVLLNLLNELGKRDKMRGLPSILSLLRNEFNKFNNTRARMLDSIYHMTNTLKSHFWRKNVIILSL